jgi:hypothetical protein
MQFNNPPGKIKNMTTLHLKKSMDGSPLRLAFLLIPLALACFALSPGAQAVSPPPDGGYPGGNTAEGNNALLNLTTGTFNTAVGLFSLALNTQGDSNTGVGASALRNNTSGDQNTAVGADALNRNGIGFSNTANGYQALYNNTTGHGNTGVGAAALSGNRTGNANTGVGAGALALNNADGNTAVGSAALAANIKGQGNTALGAGALSLNNPDPDFPNSGSGNTAVGANALRETTSSGEHTAVGSSALEDNTTGFANTAIGKAALLHNTTGSDNIAVGVRAGENVKTANKVICIGSAGSNESNTCFIGNIFGKGTAAGVPVLINEKGRLGTLISSKRFKEDIQPMDKASQALFSLKPVSFRYKKEIDPQGIPQLGLVAEDAEKVNPDLIVRDKEGKPYSVRHDAVNAMLLNEFLKQHRKVSDVKWRVAQLTARLDEQDSKIQTLSASLEPSKFAKGRICRGGPAPQTACLPAVALREGGNNQ